VTAGSLVLKVTVASGENSWRIQGMVLIMATDF